MAFATGLAWSSADADDGDTQKNRSAEVDARLNTAIEVTVDVREPTYDPLQALIDEEARLALSAGKLHRAQFLFARLLQIDPHDTRALREAGRIAHALGEFELAVRTLGRCDATDGTRRDPELHFLRGEALYVLGRRAAAEREFVRTEAEIDVTTTDRREQMWLARIAVLRGELDRALARYRPLLTYARDDGERTDISLLMIEAHLLTQRWPEAERLLREFLVQHPNHERAQEMLAWALEARGRLDEPLILRAMFATAWVEHPRKTADYARAQERAYDYPAALASYREAADLGVPELDDDIARLRRRLTPELAGGVTRRDDPAGRVDGWFAAANLPVARGLRLATTAAVDRASAVMADDPRQVASASLLVVLPGWRGGMIAMGPALRASADDTAVGGSALLRTSPSRRVQLQLRADGNLAWRESSITLREGGTADQLAGQVFVRPWSPRWLLSGGVSARRLGLAGVDGGPTIHADQTWAFAGVDFAVWQRFSRSARGEILDDEMLAPRAVVPSLVLAARHYEMNSDAPFGSRLVLIERSRIDEVSAQARWVADEAGRVALEGRAAAGYDWARDARLWRAGASVLVSAHAASRLTFDYDFASESGTGLLGRRHAAGLVLHVDL